MEKVLGDRLTTVFVQQGKYAAAVNAEERPFLDMSIGAIGELLDYARDDFYLTPSVSHSAVG